MSGEEKNSREQIVWKVAYKNEISNLQWNEK